MNQIISGIQVIKMYTWETPFETIVERARDAELSDIKKLLRYYSILSSNVLFLGGICLFFTLNCYTLLGNKITSDNVFSASQSFINLQLAFGILFPSAIILCAELLASLQRLRNFLILEERGDSQIRVLPEPGVQMCEVSSSWKLNTTTLKNITINIEPGTLCAVVGPVGSGKTSLLQVGV